MDFNKFVESKLFRGFDWLYRLLVINLLSILIPLALAIGPYLLYYHFGWYFFLIIGYVFAVFALIPCVINSFFIIKHYKEEKAGNVFILYFQNLALIFKNIYIYELTIIPAGGLLAFGSAYYWAALGAENFASFDAWVRVLMITGFVFSFFCFCAVILSIVNMPMIVSYFRMKTLDLYKMSFYIAFRYFFRTFLYLVIFSIPIILALQFPSFFLPVYTLIGISLPLYLLYLLSRNFYWHLSRNLDDLKNMDKYDLKGEDNENRN